MKTILKAVAATALISMTPATPAFAQPAATVQPGMHVVDTAGNPVGQVVQVTDDAYVVRTDQHEAALQKASFTPHEGKLLFAMTQAELNASISETQAKTAASMAVGAPVQDLEGQAAGTINAISDEAITLDLPSGKQITIPGDAIRGEVDMPATVFYNLADLEAQGAIVAGTDAATVAEAEAEAAEMNAEMAEDEAEMAEAEAEMAADHADEAHDHADMAREKAEAAAANAEADAE